MDDNSAIDLTAEIVAAYLGNNTISSADLPSLIASVHKSLLAAGKGEPEPEAAKPPAVPIRRSIQHDHIVCLEDGRKFKSLKRHIRTKYNLTPEEYRAKWDLAKDYPMVAPAYSEARSQLAKSMGLGAAGRKAASTAKRTRRAKSPAV